MPRIATTVERQNGVSAFNYQSIKEGWHIRRWIKAERKYRIKRKQTKVNLTSKRVPPFFAMLPQCCPVQPRYAWLTDSACLFINQFLQIIIARHVITLYQ